MLVATETSPRDLHSKASAPIKAQGTADPRFNMFPKTRGCMQEEYKGEEARTA